MRTTPADPIALERERQAPLSGPLPEGGLALRSSRAAARAAFCALLARDLVVAVKNLREVLPRTLMHPVLMVFVFTYVFPKIGQQVGAGSGDASYSSTLVAGVVGLSVVFQGIQAVALPLVHELGPSREIDDRVLAPLSVTLVALEKVVVGALHSLFAATVVLPLAAVVPAAPVELHLDWPVLVTLAPLACLTAAAVGLAFGTFFDPRTVPRLFAIVLLPVAFLGAVYYPWAQLGPIPWLKYAVLVNPLVYANEGFRAALVAGVPHMPLPAVYVALAAFFSLLTVLGTRRFQRRVLA